MKNIITIVCWYICIDLLSRDLLPIVYCLEGFLKKKNFFHLYMAKNVENCLKWPKYNKISVTSDYSPTKHQIIQIYDMQV